jgi:hypothetical protein
MVWVAFADESMRQRHDGSGIYAIAAPVIDLAFIEELRSCAADLARGSRSSIGGMPATATAAARWKWSPSSAP